MGIDYLGANRSLGCKSRNVLFDVEQFSTRLDGLI